MSRKILYSPGFGAGWTSWAHDSGSRKLMLSYRPIIDAIDREEELTESHPAVRQLLADIELAGYDTPYLGGLRDLTYHEVADGVRVRIDEYDGSESVIEEGSEQGWM